MAPQQQLGGRRAPEKVTRALLLTLCAVARHLGWAAMRQLISLGHDVIGCSRGDVDLRHHLAASALASHLPPSDKAVSAYPGYSIS